MSRPTKNVAIRQCRFCGCTENRACVTAGVPCYWIAGDVCSAPACERAFAASDELLDEKAAAAFLAISVLTLQAWRTLARQNTPTWYKLNKLVRYKRSDLEKYLQRNCFSSTAEEKAARKARG